MVVHRSLFRSSTHCSSCSGSHTLRKNHSPASSWCEIGTALVVGSSDCANLDDGTVAWVADDFNSGTLGECMERCNWEPDLLVLGFSHASGWLSKPTACGDGPSYILDDRKLVELGTAHHTLLGGIYDKALEKAAGA